MHSVRGAIVQTDQNSVIIDVGGVGYAVTVSGRTQGTLAAVGGTVTLLTDMQVREDSMVLYGFVDGSERDAFRLLVTVQGVGAKAAMAILSVLSPDALATAIMAGDKAMVTRADGVGPKLAQRVVNELAEKVGALPVSGMAASARPRAPGPPAIHQPGRLRVMRCRHWKIWDMAAPRRMRPLAGRAVKARMVTICRL